MLSKSRVLAGLQCHKRLYLQLTAPALGVAPSRAQAFLFDQGRAVGRLAQQAFPGGVAVDATPDRLDVALARTEALVRDPAVPAIFEATFRHDDVLVRVDVLVRSDEGRWRLIEVKSATGVRAHVLADVAIQRHVLAGCGLEVEGAAVMHVNRDYVYAGGALDATRLFTTVDVTAEIRELEVELPRLLTAMRVALAGEAPPVVAPGPQCRSPDLCEFYDRCNAPLPDDHLAHLPGLNGRRLAELLARGIARIGDLPGDVPLGPQQALARRAVLEGRLLCTDGLGKELAALGYPRAFMDFETLAPALPRFAGMRPYDAIAFQWSLHLVRTPGGAPEHHDFLPVDTGDPRRRFLESLAATVGEQGPIVVYSGFEGRSLADLASWLPDLAPVAERLRARLWDLLPVMRRHVYHPRFLGSFSLKRVVPTLVPALGYDGMEVAEGSEAGPTWDRLVRGLAEGGLAPAEAARLEGALRDYCGQDTRGLVELMGALEGYCRSSTA
jgi:uncharacterized protein DUF2779